MTPATKQGLELLFLFILIILECYFFGNHIQYGEFIPSEATIKRYKEDKQLEEIREIVIRDKIRSQLMSKSLTELQTNDHLLNREEEP